MVIKTSIQESKRVGYVVGRDYKGRVYPFLKWQAAAWGAWVWGEESQLAACREVNGKITMEIIPVGDSDFDELMKLARVQRRQARTAHVPRHDADWWA